MKGNEKYVVTEGFGMEANQFIFLDRKIETDKERISEAIHYYASVGSNYQVYYSSKLSILPFVNNIICLEMCTYYLLSIRRSQIHSWMISIPMNLIKISMKMENN